MVQGGGVVVGVVVVAVEEGRGACGGGQAYTQLLR